MDFFRSLCYNLRSKENVSGVGAGTNTERKRDAVKKNLLSLIALVMAIVLMMPAFSASAESYTAYVRNTSAGRINLRARPTVDSERLASIDPGTQVQIDWIEGKWARITVNEMHGYMSMFYLEGYPEEIYKEAVKPAKTEKTAATAPKKFVLDAATIALIASTEDTVMYVSTGNTGKLHLREFPSQEVRSLGLYPNGTQVTARNLKNGWCYVVVGGVPGFMMTKFLSPVQPSTPVPPVPVTPVGYAVVQHPHNSFVYFRSSRSTASTANVIAKLPSGTVVEVLEREKWYTTIRYNGIVGYMVSQYLYAPGTPVPAPSPVPGFPQQRVVRNQVSTYVNLRSSMSSSTNANILAKVPNGAVVEVLEQCNQYWSRVRYLEMEGFMVSSYLKVEPIE